MFMLVFDWVLSEFSWVSIDLSNFSISWKNAFSKGPPSGKGRGSNLNVQQFWYIILKSNCYKNGTAVGHWKQTHKYRVSNLKLSFSFGFLWRYGKCYDFGLLVCYTIDLRQFFGAKKPDRKWPEMTKNDLSCKNSIFDWFWTFVWSCIFDFWTMLYQYFILSTPEKNCFGVYRVRKWNL